ncbi:2-dehydropantoate 2-reductase [Aestuariicella sp. G3-2]|uniref:2-dehydropantoate 2-reductase n=1 Tax=Pseudomaricurvus albidus TaxID=2842452 RepID=UPI001C0DF791|nr:2-dehydropantoate 2-reductase [Aestuariicella albida]MBU3069415.1 2-dehydropantoate 2-reductase [Aestuariicella albida]
MERIESEHVVFGAGLVGGFLGAALMASDQSVGWVVREATRKKLQSGLKITDYHDNEATVTDLQFVTPNPEGLFDVPAPRYLWLTVKCTALDAVLQEIKSLVGPETIIICLQNGLGAEDQVQQAFPNHTVIRGVMAANVAELQPGHLHRGTQGGIMLPKQSETEALVPAFQQPALPLRLLDDLTGLLWAKLQLNLNNPINALADITLKQELDQRDYRRVLAAAMEELLSVAKAKAIELPQLGPQPPHRTPKLLRLPNWIYRRAGHKVDAKARSSMWQDLKEGRQTEIDFLNGAVARLGEELGVACPVNQALTQLIHDVEAGKRARGIGARELWDLVS